MEDPEEENGVAGRVNRFWEGEGRETDNESSRCFNALALALVYDSQKPQFTEFLFFGDIR